MAFVGFRYVLGRVAMPRGLGELQRFVIGVLGERRCGAEARTGDVAAAWAHWRAGGAEACDCPGACRLVTAARLVAVYRAVLSLERKGILLSRRDAWGRKIVRLAHAADRWRPGQDVDDAAGPLLCARCGAEVAGEWIWKARRAA